MRAQAYQRTQTETASRERILVLLLQAARRNLASASELLAQGNVRGAEPHTRKVIDIVTELNASLDPRHAPELVEQLSAVYTFVLRCLFVAATGNQQSLADATRAFLPIVEAFEIAVAQQATQKAAPVAALATR